MKKLILSLLSVLVLSFGTSAAQDAPTIELYHGDGCPHCERYLAFVPVLKMMYPDLVLDEYEVWKNDDNQEKFLDRVKDFGIDPEKDRLGVPFSIIGEETVSGFRKGDLVAALTKTYGPPVIPLENAEALYAEQNPEIDKPEDDETGDENPSSPADGTPEKTDKTTEKSLNGKQVGLVLALLFVAVSGLVIFTKRES